MPPRAAEQFKRSAIFVAVAFVRCRSECDGYRIHYRMRNLCCSATALDRPVTRASRIRNHGVPASGDVLRRGRGLFDITGVIMAYPSRLA